MQNVLRNKRLIIAIILSLVFVMIVSIAIGSLSRAGKAIVQVRVLPEDATITLDSQQIAVGEVYIEPGDYTLRVEKNGFATIERPFTILKDAENVIDVGLEAQSVEAFRWLDANSEAWADYEARAGTRAANEGLQFSEINPIVNQLPYSTFFLDIGYRLDPSDRSEKSIIIEITASDGYRELAIQQIRNWGYEPAMLNINFKDYENPFSL